MTLLPAGPCVIMKAGPHAGEGLDAIIASAELAPPYSVFLRLAGASSECPAAVK